MSDKLLLSRVAAIQRYLEARPASADTLEGIHHYWIRSRGEEETMDVTQAALDYLEVAGIIESGMANGRRIWRRRPLDGAASGG